MGYNLLKGKRGIIFRALDENSIAWKTALKVKEEGGIFTLTNAPIAMRMGKINELAKACNAEVIPADPTSEGHLQTLFTKSIEVLGGKLDFVLHSIGMSPNVRKNKDYGDLNYEWFLKTLDISGLSFHKVLQTAEFGLGFDHAARAGTAQQIRDSRWRKLALDLGYQPEYG